MTTTLSPFQLLEINLISAQDLAKVSRSMRTYAMAWVHPDRKLTTRVDTNGATNPTWNDKFVFRVDNQFLQSDTSAIMIEIYALHWFRDVHVGTVRVLVGNLIPPQTRSHNQNHIGMRFVALQVRRPSGRPQGILNVGVTVLDNTMRSMPLYTQLSASAVGYQKLMGQDDFHSHGRQGTSTTKDSTNAVQLRRSQSERSSLLDAKPGSSMVNATTTTNTNNNTQKNNSIINGPDNGSMLGGKKGKIIYDKPLSIVDGSSDLGLAMQLKAQEGKADSVLSYASSTKRGGGGVIKKSKKTPSTGSRSEVGVAIPPLLRKNKLKGSKRAESDVGGMKAMQESNNATTGKPKHNWLPPAGPDNNNNTNNYTSIKNHTMKHKQAEPYYRGYPITKDFAAGSVWSESEVGPSPSEVAAAIAEDSKYRQYDDGRSSMLDDKWSMDESEGIRTKLERWRTEMPPAYDYAGSVVTDSSSTIFAGGDNKGKHRRRHTDGGANGKFSCFGNICGYECTIVCGRDGGIESKRKKKSSGNHKRAPRAPSIDSVSTYF